FQARGRVCIPVRLDRKGIVDEVMRFVDPADIECFGVAGGDGTINVIVNAMLNAGKNVPIAIFRAGTANDFAAYYDIPDDIVDMVDVACSGRTVAADVGRANEKYFINVCAMGFMVDVSQKTDPYLKNKIGALAYYMKGVEEMSQLRPLPVRLTSAEYTGDEEMYFMIVMNGQSAGGFRRVSPIASMQDGKFDVLLFRRMPVTDFAPMLVSVLQGNHLQNRNVLYFQTSDLTIESDEVFGTDVDGDECPKIPLHLVTYPKEIEVLAPETFRVPE
ncbi:MAG: YegS/Rv2252/BmrU family lipid kinase, partial [Firmicutes bacterium]|nr:YegS/Rv2252/BmrU family lipid kinase [Bacillota bacterium]